MPTVAQPSAPSEPAGSALLDEDELDELVDELLEELVELVEELAEELTEEELLDWVLLEVLELLEEEVLEELSSSLPQATRVALSRAASSNEGACRFMYVSPGLYVSGKSGTCVQDAPNTR
ncbi:MAG: hypothetical protein QM803_06325 [Rhodocyclaceae bacterium]